MTKINSISGQIADFALNLRYEDIPPQIISYAKMLILDSFGCALLSMDEPHAQEVRRALEELPNRPEATLWGSDEKLSVEHAAIYNACLIHGQDYDDTHAGSIVHPSSSVLTSAVTLGEAYGTNGRELICSMIAAYETILRLGNACCGKMHTHFFHPTGIFAPFAAIVIAARLEKLDRETVINAMGLAGNFAAATMQFSVDGTWSKKLHPGWGIHAGLYALRFAKQGFLGSPEIFEGPQGLFMSHIGDTSHLQKEFSDFGKHWITGEIAFKFYPVCHMMHSHLDILSRLMNEHHITAQQIESITATLYPRAADIIGLPPEQKKRPDNTYLMRFSIQYILGVAALKGQLSPGDINMALLKDPAVLDMIDRVNITVDENMEMPGHFPGAVSILLKDGQEFSAVQKYETGCPENPAKQEDVLRKYCVSTKGLLSEEASNALAAEIKSFDSLDSMAPILSLLKH